MPINNLYFFLRIYSDTLFTETFLIVFKFMFLDLCVLLCIRITLEALLKDVFYFLKISLNIFRYSHFYATRYDYSINRLFVIIDIGRKPISFM